MAVESASNVDCRRDNIGICDQQVMTMNGKKKAKSEEPRVGEDNSYRNSELKSIDGSQSDQ